MRKEHRTWQCAGCAHLLQALALVIHDAVDAEAPQQRGLGGAATCADDMSARELRELRRKHARAARGRRDEHRVAALQAAFFERDGRCQARGEERNGLWRGPGHRRARAGFHLCVL